MPLAILFHGIRLVAGRKKAIAIVYRLTYRIAYADISKRFAGVKTADELNERLVHVYATAGAEQETSIRKSGNGEVVVVTTTCAFDQACKFWKMPEIIHAMCDADRQYWQTHWPGFEKTTMYEASLDPCHSRWS